jgi:hypothetical protein
MGHAKALQHDRRPSVAAPAPGRDSGRSRCHYTRRAPGRARPPRGRAPALRGPSRPMGCPRRSGGGAQIGRHGVRFGAAMPRARLLGLSARRRCARVAATEWATRTWLIRVPRDPAHTGKCAAGSSLHESTHNAGTENRFLAAL